MKTLVLGHCYYYDKDVIRCSPINVDLWYNDPFDCVDFMCNKEDATFVYDIYRSIDYRFENKIKYSGYWVWEFAENNSYDVIIDCTGSIHWNKTKTQYNYIDELLTTIYRILTPNGKFYSHFGIYTKCVNGSLSFIPKTLVGYSYL